MARWAEIKDSTRVVLWLHEHGLTYGELASEFGVSVAMVSRWVREKRPVPPWVWLALDGLNAVLKAREVEQVEQAKLMDEERRQQIRRDAPPDELADERSQQ